jgi:hypothetical protein
LRVVAVVTVVAVVAVVAVVTVVTVVAIVAVVTVVAIVAVVAVVTVVAIVAVVTVVAGCGLRCYGLQGLRCCGHYSLMDYLTTWLSDCLTFKRRLVSGNHIFSGPWPVVYR